MKKLVAVLGCVMASTGVVSGQPYVVTDSNDAYFVCGGIPIGVTNTQFIAIANPDAVQKQIRLVFSMSASTGLPAGPVVVFYNGLEAFFDSSLAVSYDTDGYAWIVAISMAASAGGQGLPVSSDTVRYIGIRFTASPTVYDSLCFDSTSSDTLGGWYFDAGPGPTWSGRKCYLVERPIPNCCFAEILNCWVSSLSNSSFCQPISYDFDATWGEGLGPPRFGIASGPGEIDSVTGVWTFTPSASDAGDTLELAILALEDWCGDGSYFRTGSPCEIEIFIPANDPPSFPPQPNRFIATTGETLAVTLQVEDSDSCDEHVFHYYTSSQDPDPPGYFDSLTGTLYYIGTTADTGTYFVFLVVSEGEFADTGTFFIYHYENSICGDLDHSYQINVADLTWMVDYLFLSGLAPVPMAAGDVDCLPGINVADLTYLVSYLFQSGPAPCEGCP